MTGFQYDSMMLRKRFTFWNTLYIPFNVSMPSHVCWSKAQNEEGVKGRLMGVAWKEGSGLCTVGANA